MKEELISQNVVHLIFSTSYILVVCCNGWFCSGKDVFACGCTCEVTINQLYVRYCAEESTDVQHLIEYRVHFNLGVIV